MDSFDKFLTCSVSRYYGDRTKFPGCINLNICVFRILPASCFLLPVRYVAVENRSKRILRDLSADLQTQRNRRKPAFCVVPSPGISRVDGVYDCPFKQNATNNKQNIIFFCMIISTLSHAFLATVNIRYPAVLLSLRDSQPLLHRQVYL